MRHSELEDGGCGALVIGVAEELLGVVIESIVLETVRSIREEDGNSTRVSKHGARALAEAAWKGSCVATASQECRHAAVQQIKADAAGQGSRGVVHR